MPLYVSLRVPYHAVGPCPVASNTQLNQSFLRWRLLEGEGKLKTVAQIHEGGKLGGKEGRKWEEGYKGFQERERRIRGQGGYEMPLSNPHRFPFVLLILMTLNITTLGISENHIISFAAVLNIVIVVTYLWFTLE